MRASVAIALAVVATASVARADDWRDHVTLGVSERVRGEFVDWFRPRAGTAPPGAQRYDFFASRLRAGVRVTFPHVQLVLQGQDTRLANLPDDATLPPPAGPLGPGALYFAHTRRTTQGEPFLKLGFLTLRRSGVAATFGRFEYSDGLETEPGNATLAFLEHARIGERLIGPFSFTHVSRSFDGARASVDRPLWNATAFAARPTRGGFEVSANGEIGDVGVAGAAWTLKRLPGAPPLDARVFWLYYDDRRDVVKVDNRPLALRTADRDPIAIHTGGANVVTVLDAGPGAVDGLLWGAAQAGRWGTLDHSAWAYAAELGYQLGRARWAPWLRGGWNQSSGDRDPTDGRHGTFFQLLPTARTYAQLPFYNLMNDADLFAQILLTPDPHVRIRSDWHRLSLTERRDLWYAGGGAGNDHLFGFTGTPSGGHRGLAQVADVSVAWDVTDMLAFDVYYGHAFGGDVVRATFAGADANYGFAELLFTY